MSKTAKREARQSRYESRRRRNIILAVAVGLIGISALVFLLVQEDQPAAGAAQEIMASRQHLPVGSEIDYNSNPPSSGPHFEIWLEPGFYEQGDIDELGANHEGFLVHNLEHGYVIFWYNCTLAGADCEALKEDIRGVMAEDDFKLIAVPWEETTVPLVLTTWGQILELEEFDRSAVNEFINRNRLRAPEPQGG